MPRTCSLLLPILPLDCRFPWAVSNPAPRDTDLSLWTYVYRKGLHNFHDFWSHSPIPQSPPALTYREGEPPCKQLLNLIKSRWTSSNRWGHVFLLNSAGKTNIVCLVYVRHLFLLYKDIAQGAGRQIVILILYCNTNMSYIEWCQGQKKEFTACSK